MVSATQPVVRRGVPIGHLAELQKTREERETLWSAEQAGIASCMGERGFEYGKLPYDDSGDVEYERTRVKPSDVDAASKLGYGLVRAIEETSQQQREVDTRGGLYLTGSSALAAGKDQINRPGDPLAGSGSTAKRRAQSPRRRYRELSRTDAATSASLTAGSRGFS
jgi:hypothetical protein